MARLTGKQRDILLYLYRENVGRQKGQIAAAVGSTPEYIQTVLTEIRKLGLINVTNKMGWWKLTERGTAYVEGRISEYREPFFTKEQVNQSIPLRAMSNFAPYFDKSTFPDDELLEYMIGIYLIKHNMELPVGDDLDAPDMEYFSKLVQLFNERLTFEWPSRNNSGVSS
jgi:hypothetical protein